jgi:hypothetical protein
LCLFCLSAIIPFCRRLVQRGYTILNVDAMLADWRDRPPKVQEVLRSTLEFDLADAKDLAAGALGNCDPPKELIDKFP